MLYFNYDGNLGEAMPSSVGGRSPELLTWRGGNCSTGIGRREWRLAGRSVPLGCPLKDPMCAGFLLESDAGAPLTRHCERRAAERGLIAAGRPQPPAPTVSKSPIRPVRINPASQSDARNTTHAPRVASVCGRAGGRSWCRRSLSGTTIHRAAAAAAAVGRASGGISRAVKRLTARRGPPITPNQIRGEESSPRSDTPFGPKSSLSAAGIDSR
ncbi:unnamed protein product [Lampetra planeri]